MTQRVAQVIGQFEPISLVELNTRAALQTRADNKYFVPWAAFVDFATTLQKTHVVLDINNTRLFTYDTQYFDTPTLANYWAHVQGRRKRFKCRSRVYRDSALCVFELKLKGGRGETIKHKIAYREDEAHLVTPEANAFLQELLNSAYGVTFTEQLVPTVNTHYQRVTLASDVVAERVTCDFNLALSGSGRKGALHPEYVLVETKSERGRGKSDQLLWRLGVRPAKASKYCMGMSIIHPHVRSNPFRRDRVQYFVTDAVASAQPAATRSESTLPVPLADTPMLAPVLQLAP